MSENLFDQPELLTVIGGLYLYAATETPAQDYRVSLTTLATLTASQVTPAMIGLGNVDNTSDLDKPISTATQTALFGKQPLNASLTAIAGLAPSNNDVIQRISGVWTNRSPAQLKTSLALTKVDVDLANVDNTSDANKPISTATQTALNNKQPLNAALTSISGLTPVDDDILQRKGGVWTNRTIAEFKTDLAYTKSDIGLGNVDNTSDADKPISTATQTALNGKQAADSDLTTIAGLTPSNDDILQRKAGAWTTRTPSQLKSDLALTKSDVGLGNVDNTSDANKPISTATQTALNLKVNSADILDHHEYFELISTSGLESGGVLSLTTGVGFSVSAGEGYCVTATDPLKKVTWGVLNGACSHDGDNFIYIDYSGSLVINSSANSDGTLIGIGYVRTTAGNTVVVGLSNTKAFTIDRWMNQINQYLQRGIGTVVEFGLNLAEQATPNELKVTMGSGKAFYGSQSLIFSDTSTFTKIFDSTDYGYIEDTSTTANTVTIGYYNDATQVAASAIVPMTAGYWKKDLFFLTADGALYYVYAQQQYSTQNDANAAAPPPLPASIKSDIFYIATVVSTTTSTSIAAGIQDVRPVFSRVFERGANAIAASVIAHHDLYDLLDDDHPQYHNDTRGDARYYTKTLADARYSQLGHTHTFASLTSKPTTLSGYGITDAQPLNTDLTTISSLTPSNDDIIQRKGGVWSTRTPAQFKTDLALTSSDVGLGNVDNTSDADKPISTATQTALNGKQPLDADLTAISAISSTGIAVRTAADTWTTRSLTAPSEGFTITNAAGIAGNPTFVLANDLAALEGLTSTGYAVRTGSDTWAQRTFTVTTNELAVTNASGAGGNTNFGIANNPILPGSEGFTPSSGTTLQRPATPLDGQTRWNTTEEILETYTSPYGTATAPVGFQRTMIYPKRVVKTDEFMSGSNQANGGVAIYGELGWTITVSNNATFATRPSELDHPGIFRLNTPGGGAGRSSRMHLGVTATTAVIQANQIREMTFLIRIPDITSQRLILGAGTDISSNTFGTNAVRFQFDPSVSAALQFICRSGGVDGTPIVLPTVVANTWYQVQAFYDGTQWVPVVNGTTYTAVTTGIPTAQVNIGVDMITNVNGVRSVDLDLFTMISRELGARY